MPVDISVIAKVISLIIDGRMFGSEGEVQTITGYKVEEYITLRERLSLMSDLSHMSQRDLSMISVGSLAVAMLFNPSFDFYQETIGPDWNATLDMIIEATDALISASRSE